MDKNGRLLIGMQINKPFWRETGNMYKNPENITLFLTLKFYLVMHYYKKTNVRKMVSIRMYVLTFVIIAKTWKQSKCLIIEY